MITYPTDRLLGVLDAPADADLVVEALAAAGVQPDGVEVLVGDDGLDRLSRLGARPSPWSRVVRLFQFLLMDQTPDFLVYEQALRDGRAVVAVRVHDRDAMLAVAGVLERASAHFLNYFGRFATEEVSLWRGPEVDLPDTLRR